MFDVGQDLPVLLRIQLGEDVVVLLLQDVYGHVEVVVLHRGRGVDGRQRGADVDHELVVEPAVIEIVADGSDEHRKTLCEISNLLNKAPPMKILVHVSPLAA